MTEAKLTIIIPTFNRSDFLIRLLNYYADNNFKGLIIVGDSSDAYHRERAKRFIERIKHKLMVEYREYVGLTEPQCTAQLVNIVATPFLAWVADDDFLVPRGLVACVSFLEAHPDYGVALGKGILFDLGHSGPQGMITGHSAYNIRGIEGKTGADRILDHLNNYSNSNFGVHRSKLFKTAYSQVKNLPDKGFTELLPNCVSTVQGKVKSLSCFYLVRQVHDRRYRLPSLFDWLTGPNWFPSYQVYADCLTRELVKQDGLILDQAHEIVKQAFWSYLKNGLTRKFKNSYGGRGPRNIKSRIEKTLKQIPGLGRILPGAVRRLSISWWRQKAKKTALKNDQDYLAVCRAVKDLPKGYGDDNIN